MRPETLQIALLVASGAVIVLVPLLLLLVAARIRTTAKESTDSALADLARQQQQTLAALQAEHAQMRREFGFLTQKRHEVYARLYARYCRAVRAFGAALDGTGGGGGGGGGPDFKKFSRDDLFRYLKSRNIRDRDAADAIAALDRGDLFAMAHLMSRMHSRVALRDANRAFERAAYFGEINELYLSNPVRDAIDGLRRNVETLSASLRSDDGRGDAAAQLAKRQELASAVTGVLQAMRNELGDGRVIPARPPLPAPASEDYRQIRSKS